ncbi:MAG: peptidylprolyl isomerase [Pegethrix bostrychoides GSE-TBD4-15B]|jgi:peptidyl-prolyl cis-trans isomerase B (cyclophilin B)|uniref:Peptidyl-prolyl cis-trans isomerase n=1 Tax=Pegethrix bostrychoides GSE-TBD4-15B TaxID=2839662 RepID=A0A951PEI6_9CYAN|nr:peptidylprolyl isomerase [Pegethrix bostrychoides GSE-TBD4-15B]
MLACLLAAALTVTGCAGTTQETAQSPAETPSPTESLAASPTESPSPSSSPDGAAAQFNNLPRLNGSATVELLVKGAPITIQVDGNSAPVTAGNFVDLVNRGVYNGLAFHRVVREPQPFVVQGGDPQGRDPSFSVDRLGTGNFIDPTTSLPRYVPLEILPQGATQPVYSQTLESAQIGKPPKLKHTRGAVAMARSNLPDSASAQFYVTLADLDFLDGNYAVFGYVTSGMDIVDQIQQGDRITSARVLSGLENLQPPGG